MKVSFCLLLCKDDTSRDWDAAIVCLFMSIHCTCLSEISNFFPYVSFVFSGGFCWCQILKIGILWKTKGSSTISSTCQGCTVWDRLADCRFSPVTGKTCRHCPATMQVGVYPSATANNGLQRFPVFLYIALIFDISFVSFSSSSCL